MWCWPNIYKWWCIYAVILFKILIIFPFDFITMWGKFCTLRIIIYFYLWESWGLDMFNDMVKVNSKGWKWHWDSDFLITVTTISLSFHLSFVFLCQYRYFRNVISVNPVNSAFRKVLLYFIESSAFSNSSLPKAKTWSNSYKCHLRLSLLSKCWVDNSNPLSLLWDQFNYFKKITGLYVHAHLLHNNSW